jgi:hypothetical protein
MRPSNRGKPIPAYPEGLVVCPGCAVGFVPVRKSARFCSDACRQRVDYQAKNSRSVAPGDQQG